MNILDSPWIRETERTGYCSSGYWNSRPKRFCSCSRCREDIVVGEDFYEIDGENICLDCMDYIIEKMRRTAGDNMERI